MRERQAIAQAGLAPRPHVLGLLDGLRAQLAAPYAPSQTDERWFLLDLCQYNDVDMAVVKAFINPQVKAVIIRIGGSASVRDSKFQLFWGLARQLKLKRAIYTYNWPGWAVEAHVRNFMETVELWTPGDLGEGPIWVDVECDAGKTRQEVSDHSISYILALERETAKIVGWYSGDHVVNDHMQQQGWMAEKPAWWAQWLYDQPSEHPGPVSHISIIPDHKIVIHQTGSNGNAALFGGSGRVDTDRWAGTEQQFYELFGDGDEPPPSGDLEEQVRKNTAGIEDLYERVNIIHEFLRSYYEQR